MTISVFIADDQAMVRQGFSVLLDAHLDIAVIGDAELTDEGEPQTVPDGSRLGE